jgi:hypothetical protein
VRPNQAISSRSALERERSFWCLVWNFPILGPIRGEHLKNMPIWGELSTSVINVILYQAQYSIELLAGPKLAKLQK